MADDSQTVMGRGSSNIRTASAGFTLIEMLIVLAIIGVVAAFVGPRLMNQLDRSKVTAARAQMRSLVSTLETMRLDLGRYPTAGEGLSLLVERPASGDAAANWQGPYLEAGLPQDPWGNAYVYRAPTTPDGRPQVGTYGSDGREGGSDLAADIFFGDMRAAPVR